MNFPQAIARCLRRYGVFSGRAARSEYWYWISFLFLGRILAKVLDVVVFQAPLLDSQPFGAATHPFYGTFAVIVVVPSLAVEVRRLHDVNRSGWWILISFTIIGILYPLLVWKCRSGTDGDNRFGPDPLAPDARTVDVFT
jgi:uncharacterized membrane protein YhaH (DUF805 family)